MSYVQLSEGGFQAVYPLRLWSRFSGVVKVWLVNYLHLHLHLHSPFYMPFGKLQHVRYCATWTSVLGGKMLC